MCLLTSSTYIEGRFNSRRWEGQDGQSRVTNEIIAQSVLFLGGSGDSGRDGDSVGGGLSEGNDFSMPTEAEDLPF